MERISLNKISASPQGYNISLSQHNLLLGGGLTMAREIVPMLYADLQGRFFFDRLNKEKHYLGQVSSGLQLRFAPLLKHDYFDPYLRLAMGYEYKNFSRINKGSSFVGQQERVEWENDRMFQEKHSVPILLGAGINLWFNEHWGLGMQTDYAMRFITQESNSFQFSLRLNYRFGGKRRKEKARIEVQEVLRVIDRPIYIDREVEKEVVKEVPILCKPILFDFDKDFIKEGQENRLEEIATVIKNNPSLHFLITGTADGKGYSVYNKKLSLRRAEEVRKALIERGVSPKQVKARGIGEKTTLISENMTHLQRQYDRRAFVEIVEDSTSWKRII